MGNTPKLRPEPEHIVFDEDDMTVGEMDDFTELTGYTMGVDSHTEVDGRQVPKPKVTVALVCIVKRRTDPEFTWEQARAVKVTALAAPESRRRPTPAKTTSSPAPRSATSSRATRSRPSAT